MCMCSILLTKSIKLKDFAIDFESDGAESMEIGVAMFRVILV